MFFLGSTLRLFFQGFFIKFVFFDSVLIYYTGVSNGGKLILNHFIEYFLALLPNILDAIELFLEFDLLYMLCNNFCVDLRNLLRNLLIVCEYLVKVILFEAAFEFLQLVEGVAETILVFLTSYHVLAEVGLLNQIFADLFHHFLSELEGSLSLLLSEFNCIVFEVGVVIY